MAKKAARKAVKRGKKLSGKKVNQKVQTLHAWAPD